MPGLINTCFAAGPQFLMFVFILFGIKPKFNSSRKQFIESVYSNAGLKACSNVVDSNEIKDKLTIKNILSYLPFIFEDFTVVNNKI